jgi:hypothetical protein
MMPDRSVVEAFAAMVESNDHVAAIQKFYTVDASTRENQNEPRVGRDVLAAREQAMIDACSKVYTKRLSPIFVDGDNSAIKWRFEFTFKNGAFKAMEEVAIQTWRGNEIVEEHFFYDPKQMTG